MSSIVKGWFSVVRLEAYERRARLKKNVLVARATGFMYRNAAGQPYLITNKHVVWHPEDNHCPDYLIAHVRVSDGSASRATMSRTRPIRFDLFKGGRKMWKALRSKADIAALAIDKSRAADWSVTYLSSSDVLSRDSSFLVGSQALILGFPGGDFGDEVSNLPIARVATMATDPRLTFTRPTAYHQRCFLVDAVTHEGMSGSPVVSLPRSIYERGSELVFDDANCYLVGIFSGFWHYSGDSLGLNTVWWPQLIEETADL